MTENIKNIIESLLFVTNEPLTVDRIKKVVTGADAQEIRDSLRTLHEEFLLRGGGFYLSEVAGGYQFRTHSECNKYIRRLIKPSAPRLSKPALETLAIVAYKQPVIRSDIEHIRGVDCGGILRTLLERKLIRILGRKEIPGRPLIYATTKMFLEVFDLKDLKDLPSPKEIEEMSETLPELGVLLPVEEEVAAETPGPDQDSPTEGDAPSDTVVSDPVNDGGSEGDLTGKSETDGDVSDHPEGIIPEDPIETIIPQNSEEDDGKKA